MDDNHFKLRQKLNGLKNQRQSLNGSESLLHKYKVPEQLVQPLLRFRKIKNIFPYSNKVLKELKDCKEEEIEFKVKEIEIILNPK